KNKEKNIFKEWQGKQHQENMCQVSQEVKAEYLTK
ncbi:hypothetical protein A2U01_0024424, partial [Trifolium medium]|nr:hypothetical protein [Trifolium medium]